MTKQHERAERMRKILAYLKETYPEPRTELSYETPFQLVVAVMLSAQCTDKKVNDCTKTLFKKYKSPKDFKGADLESFMRDISSITFFRNKARYIIAAAGVVVDEYGGKVPKSAEDLQKLPGIGYKTAHVILGELYDIWEGIPTDTHVRRFALRFDLTDKKDLDGISKDLERLVPKNDWKYVNNGLVLYGRYVCPAREHECSEHPLTKKWPPAVHRWPKAR